MIAYLSSYDLHNFPSDGLILSAIEETSLTRIQMHITREEVDHLESVFFQNIVDLDKVGVDTMDIPEWKADDDVSAEFRESEPSEEIRIERGEFSPF